MTTGRNNFSDRDGTLNRSMRDPRNQPVALQFDVFDLVRQRFGLILFFVLLGIGAGVLFYLTAPKTYRSSAKIFVDEKSAPNLNDDDKYQNVDSIEKYIEILKSTKVLDQAITRGKFESLSIFSDVEDILRYLRDGKSLIVKSADTKSNSGVIMVYFSGNDQEQCQQVLDSIVTSFGQYIASNVKDIGGETAALAGKIQSDMLTRLTQVQKEIQELMTKPELLMVDGRVVNSFHMQQARMHDELYELQRSRAKLESRIAAIKRAIQQGKSVDSLVISALRESEESSLSGYASTHSQYVSLKIREQELIQEYGTDHPEIEKIRNQISMVNQLRMQELSTLRGDGSGNEDTSPEGLAEIFIARMNDQVEMLRSEEQSVQATIKVEQEKVAKSSADAERLSALQRERDRLEMANVAIIERLGEINVLKDFSWRKMSVLNPPSIAEQVQPSLPLSLVGGLFLGSLFGLGFAGTKEAAEKTFRSSDELSDLLGARVVGHVGQFQRPRIKKSSPFAKVAPEVIAIHNPSDPNCEAYRSIRTSVFFQAQRTDARIIQLTSPIPGDGKSTTVANLAASIAQSGRSVLVIDADFRKPTQHKLFGLSNATGMAQLVIGEATPDEVVQVVQPDTLSVIACGPIPANPSELLASKRFIELINDFTNHYDFVLIDSPPLLAVTDPSVICRHADLVYMVMRIRKEVRTNAARAKEIIDSMGAEIGGVIINGLTRRDHKSYQYGGSYGYSSYGHSYGASNAPRSEQAFPKTLFDTAKLQETKTSAISPYQGSAETSRKEKG